MLPQVPSSGTEQVSFWQTFVEMQRTNPSGTVVVYSEIETRLPKLPLEGAVLPLL
jgi:hypothetical protein